jgi:probable rRNA maturation factor
LVVTVTTPDGGAVPTRGLAAWLAKAAPSGARGEVTVALVSDGRMRVLNRLFRGKNRATDVLSFPMAGPADLPRAKSRDKSRTTSRAKSKEAAPANRPYLGDVVIAIGVAIRQAEQMGHSVSSELKVLALHGFLHLLGYDHEADAGEMAMIEAKLLEKAGLPAGLTGR